MVCCLQWCQPEMLTSPGLSVSVLTSLGHCWGKVTWPQARQACIRRGRACPFHSRFPGGPKADLPRPWQLREVSIHQLGGMGFVGGTGSGRKDRAQGAVLCPETVRAAPGMGSRHGRRRLEFVTPYTAEPQFLTVDHFPGSSQTEASGTSILPAPHSLLYS